MHIILEIINYFYLENISFLPETPQPEITLDDYFAQSNQLPNTNKPEEENEQIQDFLQTTGFFQDFAEEEVLQILTTEEESKPEVPKSPLLKKRSQSPMQTHPQEMVIHPIFEPLFVENTSETELIDNEPRPESRIELNNKTSSIKLSNLDAENQPLLQQESIDNLSLVSDPSYLPNFIGTDAPQTIFQDSFIDDESTTLNDLLIPASQGAPLEKNSIEPDPNETETAVLKATVQTFTADLLTDGIQQALQHHSRPPSASNQQANSTLNQETKIPNTIQDISVTSTSISSPEHQVLDTSENEIEFHPNPDSDEEEPW